MEKNLTYLNRTTRIFISVFLVAWAVAGGPWWAFIGLYPMATGAWGYCPLVAFLKPQL
jgi:hypothetical protein